MQAPRKWSKPVLAVQDTAGEAFVANMRSALKQIAANATGAAAGRDPEYLHQLRVGVRRLRSTLRAFRELLRRGRADAIEQPWRAIMQSLGSARDRDVFHQTLEAGDLRLMAGERRAEAQRLVRALLKSPRFRQTQRRTLAWTQGHPWRRHADPAEPLRQFARPALQRLHEDLCKTVHGIDWQDAARRHRLRIRVKRMRYGCDVFATAFAHRRVRAFLDALHTLQDILGEMNDIAVQRRLLRELARSNGSAAAAAAAVVPAEAKLKTRERALAPMLGRAWRAFEQVRPFWKRREAARDRG